MLAANTQIYAIKPNYTTLKISLLSVYELRILCIFYSKIYFLRIDFFSKEIAFYWLFHSALGIAVEILVKILFGKIVTESPLERPNHPNKI